MCENKNDTMADAEKGEFVWDDLDVTGKIDMDKYDIQYISVKELISSIDDKDISVDFSIGLINIYKNNIAFITDLYFNKKKYSDIKMDRDKTIIFNPQNVKLFPENYRLQTVKNIYLVCFMKGEKIKNEKTGNEQHTINYNYPVRILRSFSKKSCDIIQVHDDYVGIIALKEALENSEKMQNAELLENSYKELEETKIKEIESELLKVISDEGIYYAASFPMLLKKVGISNFREYSPTIENFVNHFLSPEFCFGKNVVIHGTVHPGVIIYVQGRNIDTILENLRDDTTCVSKMIDKNIIDALSVEINRIIDKEGMLYASSFPVVLSQCGIEDYKCYAVSVNDFIKKYLGNQFKYISNYTIGEKTFPGVIFKDEKMILQKRDDVVQNVISFMDIGIDGEILENINSRVGIINMCTAQVGFINSKYVNKSVCPKELLDDSCSVIFNPKKAIINNFDSKLNTFDNVYIVQYHVNGTVINSKTGQEHPAFDYDFPIKVIRKYEKKSCVYLSINKEEIIINEYKHHRSIEEKIASLSDILKTELQDKEFVQASEFPTLTKSAGIKNFRYYADSVELFVKKYLPKFGIKKNVMIKGIKYPGIIFLNGMEPLEDYNESKKLSSIDEIKIEEEELRILDRLYADRQFQELLSSNIMKKVPLCLLPEDIIRKSLNSAAKIINHNADIELELSPFHMDLILTSTSVELVKKWKIGSSFTEEIMEQCASSAIVPIELPSGNSVIAKMLNRIGYSNAKNDNYTGLTKRFLICINSFSPYILFIRAFVQKSQHAIEKCISEYIQMVKDVQKLNISNDAIQCLTDFLIAIDENLLKLHELPHNLKTNVVSAYIDAGEMNLIRDVLLRFNIYGKSVDEKLVDLYFNYMRCTEKNIQELLQENVNKQLLQKVVSLLWEKYADDAQLPEQIIRILSWICLKDKSTSIDEILRFHLVKKHFTKRNKQLQLISSLPTIMEMVQEDIKMYILGSYVVNIVVQDIGEDDLTEDYLHRISEWTTFSSSMFDDIDYRYSEITSENEDEFCALFKIFRLDFNYGRKFQKKYSDWYLKQHFSGDSEITEYDLDKLYDNEAYEAYINVYNVFTDNKKLTENVEKYISALIELHRYAEAVSYVHDKSDFPIAQKEFLLIKIIVENFRENGLNAKAYSIFRESFSIDDAIVMFINYMKPNQFHIINGLMALYCGKKEYIKVMYLYQIYQSKAENGFTRLYAQIRGRIKYTNGKIKNHYDVIELAFFALLNDELIEFFEWSQKIVIPEFKDYNPIHPFAFYYNKLIENPMSPEYWFNFLSYLSRRMDINAWMIVVCETVLKRKLGGIDSTNSKFAINNILKNPDTQNIPYNFLPYIYTYMTMTNDIDICQDVCSLLKNSDVFKRLIQENPWYYRYKETMASFKNYCIEQYGKTGSEYLYNLTVLLGQELDATDLTKLAGVATDKSELFRQVCRNYIFERDIPETINLLNESEWANMTQRDAEVLNLLRMLFRDDEDIIIDEELFNDDIMVQRFKQDCATILSAYPEKEELFKFEKSCINKEYKLIVYSYVFKAIYDEDIYDENKLHFNEMKSNAALYKAYLRFLKSVFQVQLEWNHRYPFFYKRWRYLKLCLINYLYYGFCDEKEIISIMKRNGHYEEVYYSSYKPFNNLVNAFLQNEEVENDLKNFFFFSLMQGELEDFLQENHNLLEKLPLEDKKTIRKLISELDYREANRAFYTTVKEKIKKNQFEEVIELAEAVSEYALDTIIGLQSASLSPEDLDVFLDISCLENRVKVITEIFRMDMSIFEKYFSIWSSLLCSREFVFQIYGRIRSGIIGGSNRNQIIYSISEYLRKYNEQEALATRDYLLALQACMEGNQEKVKNIIGETDITHGIPKLWSNEAENIVKYGEGKLKKFKPDKKNLDNSQKSKKKKIDFVFLNRLCHILGVEKKRISIEEGIQLWGKYKDSSLDLWVRLASGVELVINFPKTEINDKLPNRNSLTLMIGLDALSPEINMTDDDRLALLCELYDNYNEFAREDESNLEKLKDYFLKYLKLNISIYGWVNNVTSIGTFLDEIHAGFDFAELRERILKPAALLLEKDISYENRYEGLLALLTKTEGLESIYAHHVFDAIRRCCQEIEEGIRLKVKIVNENNIITDGYVYFTVENTGKCTVSLQAKDIKVVFKQEGYLDKLVTIDSISDLQSGFMTGGRIKVALKDFDQSINVSLSVEKVVGKDVVEIICDTQKKLHVKENVDCLNVTSVNKYDAGPAVTDSEMLFGRSDVQETLERIIPTGITVIYGPSRIGKTSIMNWIMNDYARNKKDNVITILFGGEGGLGKETDYKANFANPGQKIPYDSDDGMSEYLLTQTIIHSIKHMKRRMRKPLSRKISDEFLHKIEQILSDNSMSISDRYYELNSEWLVPENLELWILLDEFQQVIEEGKWNPDISCEFIRVCKMLSYEGINFNIKLIVCGSDDLLRHMVLEDKSVWRQAFPKDSRIAVGPLKEKAFYDMIQNEKKIIGTNIIYSASALEALYSYTGGVALYGKEICNTILEEIQNHPEKYNRRRVIYASDIADATQLLLNRQATEIDTKTKEGILEIYDAVTKNLKENSDMQYLWFIAVWISTHLDQEGFYESAFSEKGILRDEKELYDTLSIAVARGILQLKESEKDSKEYYVFRTIFYYFAFLGFAKKNKFDIDKTNIFISEEDASDNEDERLKAFTMLDQFGELSDDDKMTVLSSAYHQKLNPTAREEFRKSIGDHYEGDNVSGTKIETMYVNVQSITNTLNGIMVAKHNSTDLLKALPRLSNYLPQLETLPDGTEIPDHRISKAMESYVEDMEEGLENSCVETGKQMIESWAILGFNDKGKFENFKAEYAIPQCFFDSLQFAFQLESMFTDGSLGDSASQIDYSPVTIMYCKLIESMLKEYHVIPYSDAISSVKTELTYRKNGREYRYRWGDIKKLTQEQKQKLTIGAFVYPIVIDNDSDQHIVDLATNTPGKAAEWRIHASFIREIRDIRNPSAHGNKNHRVTLDQMKKVSKMLLDDGGFKRLITIVKEPI